MKHFAVLLISFSMGIKSLACSCIAPGKLTAAYVDEAAAIFIGRVISIDHSVSPLYKTATFVVSRAFKGVQENDTVVVSTPESGSMCGLDFETDREWYIFSYKYTVDNLLWAGLCGRSVVLTPTNYTNAGYGLEGLRHRHYKKAFFRKNKRRVHRDIRFLKHIRNTPFSP